MVIVMLSMIGLIGIGMAGVFLTGGNVQVAANTNLRNQALYVAEAGLERARGILTGSADIDFAALLGGTGHPAHAADEIPNSLNAQGRPVGRGAIMWDANGTALFQVAYPDRISHNEAIPGDNPNGAPNAYMGSYTVYVRNDTAECRLGRYLIDGRAAGGNQMVVVRSEGTAFDNQTTVVLEVVMGPGGARIPAPLDVNPLTGVLCNSGKNACDDNNSVVANVVVN